MKCTIPSILASILICCLPIIGQAQTGRNSKPRSLTTDKIWVGTSVSVQDNMFLFIQAESDGDIAFMRTELRYDFDVDLRFYLKMSFRIVQCKKFGFYLSLPPMYYSFGKGYVTPFNGEMQWNKMVSLNIDVYRNVPVVSAQVRISLDFDRKKNH